jgi:hypothetical protein
VRDTGEVFEFVDDVKEVFNNINSFIPIYPDVGTGVGDIEFFKKYEMSAERAGREIITDMKNFTHSQSPSKRRKLTRS